MGRSGGGGTYSARVRRPRSGSAGGGGGEGTTTNEIQIPRRKILAPPHGICRSGTKFVNERWNNDPRVRVMIIDPG